MAVRSEKLDEIGLVIDFRVIKEKLRSFLKNIDHVCLNDLAYFKENNPSSENIARYIYKEFAPDCKPLKIVRVTVWESDSSNVSYFE